MGIHIHPYGVTIPFYGTYVAENLDHHNHTADCHKAMDQYLYNLLEDEHPSTSYFDVNRSVLGFWLS